MHKFVCHPVLILPFFTDYMKNEQTLWGKLEQPCISQTLILPGGANAPEKRGSPEPPTP